MSRVVVVGLGYAGLTLAVALARKGFRVLGYDVNPTLVDSLEAGRLHLHEPGVEEGLRTCLGSTLEIVADLAGVTADVAVICVPTPVDSSTKRPDCESLRTAARSVAMALAPGTLVLVRSTVPVGATRDVVLPELASRWGRVMLAYAPERTIQGQALREMEELPQVVGALDADSSEAARAFWESASTPVIAVSSLEAAEMVKLINNCHTDVIYSFGNEVALMAERLGIDPLEVVRAANTDYPRPDLSKPGFVGGGCLSKDTYLLLGSGGLAGYEPWLVKRARELNERLPVHVATRFLELLSEVRGSPSGCRVALLGFAYKGQPPTDDLRGAPVLSILPVLRAGGLELLGHDFLVAPEHLRTMGVAPTSLEEGVAGSDGVLVITDHPGYARFDWARALPRLRKPAVFFDCWRVVSESIVRAVAGVRYAGIGYG